MAVKVQFTFDPFEMAGVDPNDVSADVREEILSDVADFTLKSVLEDCADLKSPVTGGAFRKLSKDYAVAKKKQGGKPVPNLQLEGDMLDALSVKTKKTEVSLYMPAGKQALKADNHNKFSSESEGTSLPPRKFIPNEDKGETFRPAIRKGIRDIVKKAFEDS
jgi:hypothetical protein